MIFGRQLTPFTPIGGTAKVLSAPVVCLNTLIMAASLAKVRLPRRILKRYFWWVYKLKALFSQQNVSVNRIPSQVQLQSENDTTGGTLSKLHLVRQHSRRLKHNIMYSMGLKRERALTWTDMDASCVVSGVDLKEENDNRYVISPEGQYYEDTVDSIEMVSHQKDGDGDCGATYNCLHSSNEREVIEDEPIKPPIIMEFPNHEVEDNLALVTPKTFLVHALAR